MMTRMSQIPIEWALVIALSMLLANAQTVTKGPSNQPTILSSFDAVNGDPGMSYKDHQFAVNNYRFCTSRNVCEPDNV